MLDEARHGLEWLVRMFPSDSEMYNQLGDDRDHTYWDLPTNDSADYGWGKGKERPVYPCTGKPQGLFKYKNTLDGSRVDSRKVRVSVCLARATSRSATRSFAANAPPTRRTPRMRFRPRASRRLPDGTPARSPYFYEEDNWADDMELGAAALA